MKYLMCLAALLCSVAMLGQNNYGDDYDPDSPPDPETPATRYKVSLKVEPARAGNANFKSMTAEKDKEVYVTVSQNSSTYTFRHWKNKSGEIVSNSRGFNFTMPEGGDQLTAVFEYNPSNPGDPDGTPSFNFVVNAEPRNAGSFNYSRDKVMKVREGEGIYVWPYTEYNYEFVGWRVNGGELIAADPDDRGYSFNMPADAVTITGVFRFNPASPANPNANYWNIGTGELIMDDFRQGDLRGATANKISENYSYVRMLTVSGMVSNYDLGLTEMLPNCTYIDLSRTGGLDYIYGYSFNDASNLKDIMLPPCVKAIYSSAFNSCESLNSLTCYATTPPYIDIDAFTSLQQGAILYVPATALDSYKNADGWKDIFATILPIKSDVRAVEVNLPAECADGRYKNMNLELVNNTTGQKHIYIINDRIKYVFNGLIKNQQFTAYLRNQQGLLLGQIDNINVTTDDVAVTFGELLTLYTANIKVLSPSGDDITADVQSIQWMDAKGDYLSRADSIAGQLEGTELQCLVTLTQEQGMQYRLPEAVKYTVDADNLGLTLQLTAIEKTMVGGVVYDLTTKEPVEDASVVFLQTLNGLYAKTIIAKTNEAGKFSAEVYNDATTLSVAKADYISTSRTCEGFTTGTPMDDIYIKPISGAIITTELSYTESVVNQGDAKPQDFYNDYNNVSFTLNNRTQGKAIEEFSVQPATSADGKNCLKIVLLDEVAEGDVIDITASSLNAMFNAVKTSATIDATNNAKAKVGIVALGGLSVSKPESANADNVCILYNAAGTLLKAYNLDGETLTIRDLPDGNYQLVAMAASSIFNSIQTIDQLKEVGLKEKTHYLIKSDVTVKSGSLTAVKFSNSIPLLNETVLSYTGQSTLFEVNKNQIVAGSYLTLKANVDFKANVAGKVSDLKLLINLPEGCKVTQNSVMLGTTLADYTYDEKANQVTVPVANIGDVARLCFVPTLDGEQQATASVEFTLSGITIRQPIGMAAFTVKNLSITVPGITRNTDIPVCGTAMSKSKVTIYDNGTIVGTTTALANGYWSAMCALTSTEPEHKIYAMAEKDEVTVQSSVNVCTYDPNANTVSKVTMINTAHPAASINLCEYVTDFNFLNPKQPGTYWYWPNYPDFTFKVEFAENDTVAIKSVNVVVHTTSRKNVVIPAKFNEKKGCWIATKSFDSQSLPANVTVQFTLKGSDLSERYPGPDAPHVMDPSGYVYEGVESNRLEGVKATAYYKKCEEDNFGDIVEEIVVWDAENWGQENPLWTDANGMYAWDVPEGLWQVKFEKDGYETAYSEWLPVPPPQMDINVAMTQYVQPRVETAAAYEDAVEVTFDKYMDIETLTTANIAVYDENGDKIAGAIETKEVETSGDTELTRSLRYVFVDTDYAGSTVNLKVSRKVESYAGKQMLDDYDQAFDIEKEVKSVVLDPVINVIYGESLKVTVAVEPAEASKGKTLVLRSASKEISEMDQSVKLDENGQCTVDIVGGLPGSTQLVATVDGTNISAQGKINVVEALVKPYAPVPNIITKEVYRGTQITLASETENVDIYYTTGSGALTADNRQKYDGSPIVVDGNMQIQAIAESKKTGAQSDVKTYNYTIRKSSASLPLKNGWNWISHNVQDGVDAAETFAGAERVVTQTKEIVNDPKFGLIGNLAVLQPTENAKVFLSADKTFAPQGDAADPTATEISISEGWNWIGYPVEQTQSLDEAFTLHNVSEGDMLMGNGEGFAVFADGQWVGDLKALNPGHGYMYKSKMAGSFHYSDKEVSKAKSLNAKGIAARTRWTAVDYHQYPSQMGIIGDIADADNADYTIAAFDANGECRGVGTLVKDRIFISVYGGKAEDITFLACDNNTDVVYDISQTMQFTADIIGSMTEPYMFSLGKELPNGIVEVKTPSMHDGKAYDLSGRAVSGTPARGTYIVDGKKVVITK